MKILVQYQPSLHCLSDTSTSILGSKCISPDLPVYLVKLSYYFFRISAKLEHEKNNLQQNNERQKVNFKSKFPQVCFLVYWYTIEDITWWQDDADFIFD